MKFNKLTVLAIGIAMMTTTTSCEQYRSEKVELKATVESAETRKVPTEDGKAEIDRFQIILRKEDNTTEMFVLRDDWYESHYNNSEIFYGLKAIHDRDPSKVLTFTVKGYGKSWWYDYRYILSYKE